jgi:hypothetical protein
MGSKSQRKKEQFAQRRNEKRKRQQAKRRLETRGKQENSRGPQLGIAPLAEIPLVSNARHRQRLAQQVPQSWPGELPEDAAIFDDAALAKLLPELTPQVSAVREALQDALASRGDDALKRVSAIPRSSPLSEWRLFLRGLIDWLAGASAKAGDTWKRLDPERRPGRIATAMMIALRHDLEHATPCQGQPESSPTTSTWDRFDDAQLYHGKLLRRVRFDRAALRVAEAGVNVPEEAKELLLGPRKIHWLKQFIAEYEDTEPELATAMAQVALRRAYAQTYCNLFDEAARKIRGPRHDRRNLLLTFFFYNRFTSDSLTQQKADRALKEYLTRDLPQNESLSAPLRDAIASQIHLNEALFLMQPADGDLMFNLNFGASKNTKEIRNHLLAAVKAVPGHSAVYKTHVNWINSKLDYDRIVKAEQSRLKDELADVMRRWSQGAPDETEPRLWLVDYLLENEQLDEARPHVEFLAASRQDHPRVRATPWKWQLLEAMRLCRRKAWLADVPARLDEAEKTWPAWLPMDWLPYFKAAWTLRTGRTEAFEDERRRICEKSGRVRDSLADACLMLSAAQLMRATPAELKPLRAAADQALQRIDSLPLADLFETGSFFWDLHRVQLLYPAYRLQGKAVGKALFGRLGKNPALVLQGLDDARTQQAVLWGSEYRFWSNGYETKFPSFFSKPATQRHPVFAAARLNALLKERYAWGIKKHQELGPLLRAAAAAERDVYHRHWFLEMADQLDDRLAQELKRSFSSPFGNLFGFGERDAEEDDLGFDPNCDCSECRAARQAQQQTSASDQLF